MIVSMAGSQLQLAALHWHIRDLTVTANPMALGGIGLARILPVFLCSPIAGPLADATDRRRIVFITQSAMAVCAGVLALLTFTGTIALWHIYLLTALQAVATAFDLPARQAMVPNLVPRSVLANAFTMQSIAANTGAILGPVLAGVVIATLGQGWAYLFNALSFLAVLLALSLIGPLPQEIRHGAKLGLSAMADGFRFIFTRPIMLSTMLLDFSATFFASANTLMPIVARDLLKVGTVGYGWLVAAQSIGSVTAAALLSQVRALRRQGPVFLAAVLAFGAATVVFGLSRNFALSLAALIFVGAADAVSTIVRNTIRQLNTPDSMRGRMTGVSQLFFQGGPQLGEVEAGAVASAFGVPFAIVSGGLATMVVTGVIIAKWPQLRNYDGPEGPPKN